MLADARWIIEAWRQDYNLWCACTAPWATWRDEFERMSRNEAERTRLAQ
jgi:hypothetical protein